MFTMTAQVAQTCATAGKGGTDGRGGQWWASQGGGWLPRAGPRKKRRRSCHWSARRCLERGSTRFAPWRPLRGHLRSLQVVEPCANEMHFDEAMNESNVRFFMGTSAQRSTTLGKLHYCLVCVGRSALSKTRSIQSLHSFTFRGHKCLRHVVTFGSLCRDTADMS